LSFRRCYDSVLLLAEPEVQPIDQYAAEDGQGDFQHRAGGVEVGEVIDGHGDERTQYAKRDVQVPLLGVDADDRRTDPAAEEPGDDADQDMG